MQVDAIRRFSLHSPLPLLSTTLFLQILFLADASYQEAETQLGFEAR